MIRYLIFPFQPRQKDRLLQQPSAWSESVIGLDFGLLHTFNVSKWQVERICKRYQETGDSLLVCLIAPGGVDASDARFVKNCMSDSCSQWSLRSYCCPETSAKQETAKKLCCVRQGPQPDGRLDSKKLQEGSDF